MCQENRAKASLHEPGLLRPSFLLEAYRVADHTPKRFRPSRLTVLLSRARSRKPMDCSAGAQDVWSPEANTARGRLSAPGGRQTLADLFRSERQIPQEIPVRPARAIDGLAMRQAKESLRE